MTKQINILIVDDNKNNLFSLRTLLNEYIDNINIIEADSGEAALALILKQSVNLIILDVQMPDMDGFETAHFIRNRKKTRHIPIVFLTAAYKSKEFQQKGLDIGATDYLTKPIDTEQLITRVKIYLRFIQQEQTHFDTLYKTNQQLKTEIIEREQAQNTIETLSHKNELILNSVAEGIYEIDLKGNTTFINPAAVQMLGFQPEEIIGKNQHPMMHHSQADGSPYPLNNCPINNAITTGKSARIEHEVFWHKDGYAFPVEYSVAPIKDHGVVTGAVVTFSDITERKKVMHALEQARIAAEQNNIAKSQFLANISHELRTPLNAIIGYSEMLIEEAEDDDMDSTDLNKIHSAGTHLLSLINDVLDISKIEAGKIEIFNETVHIHDLIKEIINTLVPLAQKQAIKLDVNCPEDIGVLKTDLTKVRQILLNLLNNAIKFTEEGKVFLEVKKHKNVYIFKIRDEGIGISEEQQQRLFQPFTQADASTTRKYGGTGLGLTISKHFADIIGGQLTLRSTLGKGSTFTLCLPKDSKSVYCQQNRRQVPA